MSRARPSNVNARGGSFTHSPYGWVIDDTENFIGVEDMSDGRHWLKRNARVVLHRNIRLLTVLNTDHEDYDNNHVENNWADQDEGGKDNYKKLQGSSPCRNGTARRSCTLDHGVPFSYLLSSSDSFMHSQPTEFATCS